MAFDIDDELPDRESGMIKIKINNSNLILILLSSTILSKI